MWRLNSGWSAGAEARIEALFSGSHAPRDRNSLKSASDVQ
jgi:hypothetical protein